MDLAFVMPFLTVVGFAILIILGLFGLFKAFYIKVPQGTALIVNDMTSQPKVHFTGALVYPVIYKKEFMRISLLTLEVDRRGKDGLICQDNLRADITVAFYLRVNETTEDVLKVAKAIGVDRASDHQAVSTLFSAKFSEALKTVGKQFELSKLFEDRQNFRDRIVDVIGKDLNGYALEDVAIDYLEQTPKSALDPNNIFDSEGIRKITEITAIHNIETNQKERDQELAIQKKNVETREASLALERQQADAEARQKREIDNIRARENSETLRVQEEERLKAEQARIQTQQEIEIREENRMREVEVAQQNRTRAVTIEQERVNRARELEIVAREREVELQRIEKEKALEEERKNISNVIRERVAVEKTVAQEEERIKEVREVSEAERMRQVTVINAQAEAEESLVRQVKRAEADESSAKHKAEEISTMAKAELEASVKQAEAKKRLAEGIEAEHAALGLAEARVRQATAEAEEKEGLVLANVTAEKLLAEARGMKEKGLTEAQVMEAKAQAQQQQGFAEAKILEEKLAAQARGEEQQANAKEKLGLADAKILEEKLAAQARGEGQLGSAQAEVIRQRLKAEADGLTDKFKSMDHLSDTARSHEEFRMRLEKQFEQAMASIEANKEIAREQADVLAAALSKTNIEIVGGDGNFFNTFSKALSLGKAVDGFMDKSSFAKENVEKLINRTQQDKKLDIASLLKNPEVQDLLNGFMATKGASQLIKDVTTKSDSSKEE
ncbi:flotillin family protein [Proteus cibarius]|uniref:Flotillin family protein n=2 Tax=Morganellaceae TaxID=1903414 RepID=A0A6G6SBU9_9GAMM|nr:MULTISPECIES: flotillin family protein [Proteus]QHP77791.1 flotillin family protein [Proteus vulgaris]MBG2915985.1 flotillin family protein [Proteus terrae subsp. cibarius]MBG3090414.1 flotillin family protein [Proteus terrae subsp. cibarius]MBG6038576.1 flotillin family protein [Proteus terrae subsp. cibarius]MCM2368102.1 flotillin family protein [Proteus sp. FZP2095]